jgi:type III secretion protein J
MKTIRTLAAIFIIAAFFMTGCGRVALYQNLSEEDANEILVLLSEKGIKATKTKEVVQNEVSYSIHVPDADMVRANSLLVQHNLPRHRELGLTGVYNEKGLIPTPDEQKARMMLALKGDIINSLEKLPQIVDADVVLNIPTKDEFADPQTVHMQRPTASVIIKARPPEEGEEQLAEAKLQQFVANGVEGMNPRDVTVIISYLPVSGKSFKPEGVKSISPGGMLPQMTPATPPPVFTEELIGLRLDEDSKAKLKIYLLIFFILLIVLSSALIIVIVQHGRMRRDIQKMKGPAGRYPAIEGQVMDEGPPELPGK